MCVRACVRVSQRGFVLAPDRMSTLDDGIDPSQNVIVTIGGPENVVCTSLNRDSFIVIRDRGITPHLGKSIFFFFRMEKKENVCRGLNNS